MSFMPLRLTLVMEHRSWTRISPKPCGTTIVATRLPVGRKPLSHPITRPYRRNTSGHEGIWGSQGKLNKKD
jgi:hypothetical protein